MSVTESQFQLFKSVANPARFDMHKTTDSPTFFRINKRKRESSPPPSPEHSPQPSPIPSPRPVATPSPQSRRSRSGTPSPKRIPVTFSNSDASLNAEKEAEKIGFLMEIRRLQSTNPKLRGSRQYTCADSHQEIEMEYNRFKIAADTYESVSFMCNCLKMGVSGLEMANSRFGPWLSIDGFSEEACSDMNKFRPALTRIYKRVWRRGCMNPWVELLMLLGGGLLMFHFKSKLLGTTHRVNHSKTQPVQMPSFNLGAFNASDKTTHQNHGVGRMKRPSRTPMPPPEPTNVVRHVTLKKIHSRKPSTSISIVREPLEIDE